MPSYRLAVDPDKLTPAQRAALLAHDPNHYLSSGNGHSSRTINALSQHGLVRVKGQQTSSGPEGWSSRLTIDGQRVKNHLLRNQG